MKVFIGAVSGETQYVGSLNSLYALKRRPGDELIIEYRTRGDVARENVLDAFLLKKEFDGLLMLDADQRHPPDMLERLRIHLENGLDMVCAHYYRRTTKPIQSLCYELGDGTYPALPLLDPPTEGLHEISMTGLGCVIIHRRVLEAVQATLPKGMSPFAIAPLPDVTGDYDNFGPDFRFFILARRLGYKLWLDASLESLHGVTMWLGHKGAKHLKNYVDWADAAHEVIQERVRLYGMGPEALRQRKRILEARLQGLVDQEAEISHLTDEESMKRRKGFAVGIYEVEGRIKEVGAWEEWLAKYPKIERPEQLPTTESMPPQRIQGVGGSEVQSERMELYRENAQDLIETLPKVNNG